MSEQDSTSSTLKLEWIPDHKGDGQTSGIYNAEPLITSGDPAWNCRDTSTSSWEDDSTYGGESGRVITVQWGECTKRIGIDGSSEEIKHSIKTAFGLKARQDFWLEDEHEVVRPLDRDMRLTTYTIHLVEGLVMKVCLSADPNHAASCDTVEKELYTQGDFTKFLDRRGWIGLKGLRDDQIIDMIDDLKPDVVYHGLMR